MLKFGEDWSIISYSCPYTSMLNLVSFCELFNMAGVGGHITKFNIEVYGQLNEIILQSSPNFNTSCRTICIHHIQSCREIESKLLKYNPKTGVVHETTNGQYTHTHTLVISLAFIPDILIYCCSQCHFRTEA